MKPRRVELKFVRARSEKLCRWQVVKVVNSFNPSPGDMLTKEEVATLMHDRTTTVTIK